MPDNDNEQHERLSWINGVKVLGPTPLQWEHPGAGQDGNVREELGVPWADPSAARVQDATPKV